SHVRWRPGPIRNRLAIPRSGIANGEIHRFTVVGHCSFDELHPSETRAAANAVVATMPFQPLEMRRFRLDCNEPVRAPPVRTHCSRSIHGPATITGSEFDHGEVGARVHN